MKKCPQCNTVYDDSVAFCLNDGTALIDESATLHSATDADEPETIIRNEPIVIDFTESAEPTPVTNHPVIPAENIVVVPADTTAINRNYAVFLILGLVIGGGLVLATLWFSKNLYQAENANSDKININYNQAAKNEPLKIETPKPTIEAQNNNVAIETTSNKHSEANESFTGTANGRVIALNARVRLAPDKDAPVVDTLPMDDRIEIIRRQNPNSPWYQIECEHGTTGWMHGDTIEFTR
jgi:hypothetical protein